jgi:hypothetical protein
MGEAKKLPVFLDKIKLALDLFDKYGVPYEIINIKDDNGREIGGIQFLGCHWANRNTLVENKK